MAKRKARSDLKRLPSEGDTAEGGLNSAPRVNSHAKSSSDPGTTGLGANVDSSSSLLEVLAAIKEQNIPLGAVLGLLYRNDRVSQGVNPDINNEKYRVKLNKGWKHNFYPSRINSNLLNYDIISSDKHSKIIPLSIPDELPSVMQRLDYLQKFADEFQGKGVADYVRKHFPEIVALEAQELASVIPQATNSYVSAAGETDAQTEIASPIPVPPFPKEAPIKWKDREPGETAPDFTRRVYGPWLEGGISKRALRALDPVLINELNSWVRSGNELPADIRLLTVGEEKAQLLAAGPEAIKEHLGKFTGAEIGREARRLGNAMRHLK